MVVFDDGYRVDRLAQAAWLRDRKLLFWGDIDTHGFAILDRLRAKLPHVRSLLMNVQTLRAHQRLWGTELPGKRFAGELERLTDAERRLFLELSDTVHGEPLRMEQERIGDQWALAATGRV